MKFNDFISRIFNAIFELFKRNNEKYLIYKNVNYFHFKNEI